jgi:two-component system, OmpR family, phosphate regulon sensor histidine kinase PhoR
VWNSFKTYLTYPFVKEFIIFTAAIILLIFLLAQYNLTLLIISLFLSIAFLFLFIMKRRRRELDSVKEIIKGIKRNTLSRTDDIILDPSLKHLESEIKLMYEKIKGDIEYLRKLEKMRTEFLANVSHELKTPIFTIQGYIETLLTGAINDPEVNYKFLGKANEHTLSLSNLVNDLINISMIESGEMRMSFRYFNINQFLKEVVNEISPLAEEKHLELEFSPARENLLLFGDKTRLKHVMLNLVSNAVKYTDSGKIEVIVEEEERYGRISVKDTGIGIAESDLERVFERFYRVDKARSKSVGGTGLGLAIVKHIIEAHGSKIELKSYINKGSEFFFRLKK